MKIEKLITDSLRARIADQLEAAILDGTLHPGERLVERTLASQFGTSLTAVREALVRLETDGLVRKQPNAATHVTQFSLQEIEAAFTVRRVLEGLAVELALDAASDEQIADLGRRYETIVDAARAGDRKLFLESDLAWHEALWRTTGNDFLISALRRLIVPLFAFTAIRTSGGDTLDLLEDALRHQPLVEAIKRRDVADAKAALDHAIHDWVNINSQWVKKNG